VVSAVVKREVPATMSGMSSAACDVEHKETTQVVGTAKCKEIN
jgi:hypothetical protein